VRVLVVLNNSDKYLTLWQAITDLDTDLHVIAPRRVAERLHERPGLTVHPVEDRFIRPGRDTWRIYSGLRKLVRAIDPDLIHLTSEPWSIAATQALLTRRPTVMHGAETIFRSGSRPEIAVRSLLCRMNLPRFAGYVGWNSMTVSTAISEGLPSTTPTLVAPAEVPDPRSFDAARHRRASFRAEARWPDDDLVVGFVGRYVPEKGLSWLLEAFERVSMPALRLACFGDGPDRVLIEGAAATSNGRICDHGPVAFETVPELMASLDILAIPSTTADDWVEQFGRVAIEAMLAGTPIVSSDSGALPEVLGDASRLVAEGDADALALALDELAVSEPERAELARIGRIRAMANFSPEVIAGRLVEFWAGIARMHAPTETRAPRAQPVVAVLMAAHNRVGTTLRCLESLGAQTAVDAQIEIFLVDDASTDGTAAAVAERFPDVNIIEGGGALYWSGAMRLAQIAARSVRPDFLLWLNDDVRLDPDALERLLSVHRQLVGTGDADSIVVGGMSDPDTGGISYAGVTRPDRRRPTRFELVEPTDRLQKCDSMNGNLVLVPEVVFRKLDGFDSSFRHAMSDFDFGLRASAQGCGVWLAPGTFGTCPRDHSDQPWSNRDLGFFRRVRVLLSPKGLPPGDWLRFTRRHAGPLWALYFASPYVRFAGQILRGK
jgi:GT2 family glycosyltransferase/glycosyltransferase involved in cell wall biosynthesis